MQKQCTQQTCNAFRWYSKAYSTYSCPLLNANKVKCYVKARWMSSGFTGDWFDAAAALLGEQIAEAFGAEGLVVARRELLAGEHLVAVGAREALAVPRCVLVRYPAFVDHLHVIDHRCTRTSRHHGTICICVCTLIQASAAAADGPARNDASRPSRCTQRRTLSVGRLVITPATVDLL